MLFTDPFFLHLFLPVVLALCLGALVLRPSLVRPILIAASLYFYACFNPVYLALLLGSIGANYWIAGLILGRPHQAKTLMLLGVTGNLGLLVYFKYLGFFAGLVDAALGLGMAPLHILLPLGISFFSFTQLAYLVDCWRGVVRPEQHNLPDYILFVTFFPHLVAGPVLHHAEMMPQFDARPSPADRLRMFGEGVVLFAVGLFKKLVIADAIAPLADRAFGLADTGQALGPAAAWTGTLAYTLQIYFDFSGYSDMAVGLGLMFAVRLPWNFDSPYKSANITVFWRCWHMTLSRWLRDYLYIPLGGSRKGPWRRYFNLAATMVLGGLWHGAALNFVIWGALHGAYLVVHNLWRAALGSERAAATGPAAALGWALTMLAVMVAWVFFRATTTEGAMGMLWSMAGLQQGAEMALTGADVWMLALASLVAVAAPNSLAISRSFDQAMRGGVQPFALRMALGTGCGVALVAAYVAALRVSTSPFLYFNF